MEQENSNIFIRVYERLYSHYGPQRWWPGEGPLEMLVGAVLTQNTNWANVEKAIQNLKEAGRLTFTDLCGMEQEVLAGYIRSSGYYNIKARRIKNLLQMIEEEYEGELGFLFEDSLAASRENLLSVKGVGPETADSILLYAAKKPIFVVDTYTYRVFSRHQLVPEDTDYFGLQQESMDHLPEDVELFNEFHALIVAVAKEFCKKTKPRCAECPLHGVEL